MHHRIMNQRGIQRIVRLIGRYHTHNVAQQGAALAYYLLFSLFPILILVSSLIGQLALDLSGVLDTLALILPNGVLALIDAYLGYVSEHVSVSMLCFSAVFSIWFPMRATGCLMRSVRRAYGLDAPKSRIRHGFKVLFFTVLLLFSLVLTLLLMTLGSRAADAIGQALALPGNFPRIWRTLRFAALAAVIFAAVSALYTAAQDKPRRARAILPGAALATLSWITLSFGYSVYAEYFSNYTAVYGTLSTIIVLLIWLYLTALTLIVGAEFNHTILTTP